MNLAVQRNRFAQNWEDFSPIFGQMPWEDKPNFLFFIEIELTATAQTEMSTISQALQKLAPTDAGEWQTPEKMHITLALPGREGVHFQGNDVNVMKQKLGTIFERFSQFKILLGHLNCFTNVLFREVLDEGGKLALLHYQICQEIPFAQSPEYQFEHFLPHISLLYAQAPAAALLKHAEFSRELPESRMMVSQIAFGRARDEVSDQYKKTKLLDFSLSA